MSKLDRVVGLIEMTNVRNLDDLDERRERVEKKAWQARIDIKKRVFKKPFLDAKDCKVNDLVFDTCARVFRVEKVTPKTITLSEYWGDNENDFRNERKMHHDTFAWEYRSTNWQEMKRITQLAARWDFVRKFGKD